MASNEKATTILKEILYQYKSSLEDAQSEFAEKKKESIEGNKIRLKWFYEGVLYNYKEAVNSLQMAIKALEQEPRWIPVSKKLPKELEPVNITWINHNPESYYADIKDKPFTATGVYFNRQWYWWSTLCTDILAKYSHNYDDVIDEDIEIIAWQPLPKPYKAESEGK